MSYEIIQGLNKILNRLDEIEAEISTIKKNKYQCLQEEWIDSQQVQFALKICKRTLQTMRNEKQIPYARINRKFYYKISDIEKLLEESYKQNRC